MLTFGRFQSAHSYGWPGSGRSAAREDPLWRTGGSVGRAASVAQKPTGGILGRIWHPRGLPPAWRGPPPSRAEIEVEALRCSRLVGTPNVIRPVHLAARHRLL
jgi:hypothetical protein